MPFAATGWTGSRPPATRPYLRLSRADRPIGTWLLLIPCWWGLLLAAAADPAGLRPQDAWIALGCALGAVLMRGAGCTWNDLTDRDFDARVARTRSRPLPSGQVTPRQAAVWMVAQALARLRHPADLPGAGDPARRRLAGAGRDLPVRQALHLVAAGLPRPRLQLGRAARLGRPRRRPRPARAAALRRRHRLDAVLRHDLRPPGPRGRRADRGALDRPAVRRGDQALARRLPRRPPSPSPRSPSSPPASPGAPLAAALAGVAGFALHLGWQLRRLDIDDAAVCLMLFRSNRDAGLLLAARPARSRAAVIGASP